MTTDHSLLRTLRGRHGHEKGLLEYGKSKYICWPEKKDLGKNEKFKMKQYQVQKQDLEVQIMSSVKSENGGEAGQVYLEIRIADTIYI